jgi:hypothetical protein
VGLCWAGQGQAVTSPESSFLSKDWLLAGCIGTLQLIAIGYIRKIDNKLEKHSSKLGGQAVRLAEGEGRMDKIEAICKERHGHQRTDDSEPRIHKRAEDGEDC